MAEGAVNKRTIVKDEQNRVLLDIFDDLTQVRPGRDFYIGQKRYVVTSAKPDNDQVLVIVLKDPEP